MLCSALSFPCSCCSGFRERVSALKAGGGGAPLALSNGISVVCWDLCLLKGHAVILRVNTCSILMCCCLSLRIFEWKGKGFFAWKMCYFLICTAHTWEKVWLCVFFFKVAHNTNSRVKKNKCLMLGSILNVKWVLHAAATFDWATMYEILNLDFLSPQ